jgi:hypothetical protein
VGVAIVENTQYDPAWVLDLARAQYPDDEWLHASLAACTTVARYCACGCGTPYFVELAPDTQGEESDFGMRIRLKRERGAVVTVDFLPDGRIACIEG